MNSKSRHPDIEAKFLSHEFFLFKPLTLIHDYTKMNNWNTSKLVSKISFQTSHINRRLQYKQLKHKISHLPKLTIIASSNQNQCTMWPRSSHTKCYCTSVPRYRSVRTLHFSSFILIKPQYPEHKRWFIRLCCQINIGNLLHVLGITDVWTNEWRNHLSIPKITGKSVTSTTTTNIKYDRSKIDTFNWYLHVSINQIYKSNKSI